MKIHLISIGGAAMHNVAIALHLKGYEVTGSDDQIFDPSKSRLEKYGLLPFEMGWFPERINEEIDVIILGMHARENNPELKRAQQLGLKIYSYPEYIFEQSQEKTRVVIGGSHGKTSTTSMILHVLNYWNIANDFMVGAQLDGFECMVKLSDAPVIILEGDEYLSSPIDRRPKFHWYKPHISVLTGIAWDHINVFPTFENYIEQFSVFVKGIEEDGQLIYFEGDQELVKIAKNNEGKINTHAYLEHPHEILNGKTQLISGDQKIPVEIFGKHNLENLMAAYLVCSELNLTNSQFYEAIGTFKGAARRLETIAKGENFKIFKDFAHSPSKLKATTEAVKNQWPNRKLVACMELHTFSSLDADFLKEYAGSMDSADRAIVYFSPKVVAHKKLSPITTDQIKEAFEREDLEIVNKSEDMKLLLKGVELDNCNLLLMSSGNYGGINIDEFSQELATKRDLAT